MSMNSSRVSTPPQSSRLKQSPYQKIAQSIGRVYSIIASDNTGQNTGTHTAIHSLANELANAWDNDDESASETTTSYGGSPAYPTPLNHIKARRTHDSGVSVSPSPLGRGPGDIPTSPTHLPKPLQHRSTSQTYDGSDYGPVPDDQTDSLDKLDLCIDRAQRILDEATESLSITSIDPVAQLTRHLRDLTSQSEVDASTTRLITAFSAVVTNINNATRTVQQLAYSLLTHPLGEGEAADMSRLIEDAKSAVPQLPAVTAASLSHLSKTTLEASRAITNVSDCTQAIRPTSETAARRLGNARQLVAQMRQEENEMRAVIERFEAERAVRMQELAAEVERAREGREAVGDLGEGNSEHSGVGVARGGYWAEIAVS